MTLLNALASSPTGMAMRFYNDLFMQVVTKVGNSYFVVRQSRGVTTCPLPSDEKDNWQILLPGPTHAAINNTVLGRVA